MPSACTTPLLGAATAVTALALIAGCDRPRAGAETAGATTTETAAATAAAVPHAGAVPLTTASDEARRLYLEGRALSEQLKAHDGRKLYQQAVAADSSFAMAHYQLAANAATAKDFFDHLGQAVALADRASEGERLTILALEAGGNADPRKQLTYQQELVSRYPGDERAHFLLGGGYFGRQQFDQAIEQYQQATTINPEYSPAYNLLGYAYRNLERYDEAESAFKRYIELIPGDPNPYDSYAELLMKTGRFEESIAQYRKALSLDSHFTPSRVGIANNLMLQGRHAEAAAEMDRLYQAARDDGDRRTAFFVKGVILVDAGKFEAAVREIGKEYALDARLADTANMSGDAQLIGNILLQAGRTDAAAGKFRLALDLIENSSLADDLKQDTRLADHYNRGRVALAGGDLATAKSAAAEYAAGARSRGNQVRIWQAHELAGRIALAEKDYDRAVAELGQASQQDPYVLYTTALAWHGKGDRAKAKELAGRAANANVLPLVTYAFIRQAAKRMS